MESSRSFISTASITSTTSTTSTTSKSDVSEVLEDGRYAQEDPMKAYYRAFHKELAQRLIHYAFTNEKTEIRVSIPVRSLLTLWLLLLLRVILFSICMKHANFQEFRHRDDCYFGYIQYCIRIEFNGYTKIVWKRYSEFLSLNDLIQASHQFSCVSGYLIIVLMLRTLLPRRDFFHSSAIGLSRCRAAISQKTI